MICEFKEHQGYAEAINISRKNIVTSYKETRFRLNHLTSNSRSQKEMFQ